MDNEVVLKDDLNPSIYGILAGICKGDRWSLSDGELQLDVAYSHCLGGCGVVGSIPKHKEESAREFFEKVFLSLLESGVSDFEFSSEDSNLMKALLELFSDKELYSEEEFSYRKTDYCQIQINSQEYISEYTIREVDQQFFGQISEYENADLFIERLHASWFSLEDFLEYSKSFVAIYENKIVGIIFGSARYSNIIAVDIEVLQEHRRQGLAAGLTSKFMNSCVESDCTVQWDCTKSNEQSSKLAQKCGFQRFKTRPFYWFSL